MIQGYIQLLLSETLISCYIFLFPFSAQAGFQEGESDYDLKIEDYFRLPCDEIRNDDCTSRALGVIACAWIFTILVQ